jgi:hypothetical protein
LDEDEEELDPEEGAGLAEEADMPLEELLKKYKERGLGQNPDEEEEEEDDDDDDDDDEDEDEDDDDEDEVHVHSVSL